MENTFGTMFVLQICNLIDSFPNDGGFFSSWILRAFMYVTVKLYFIIVIK